MDILRLRILTKKSVLGFGKYESSTQIGQLIDLDPTYLIWIYFNSSKISFNDEVLDELHISERIKKPGIKRAWCSRANRRYWSIIKKELSNASYFVKAAHARKNLHSINTKKEKRVAFITATTGRKIYSIGKK